MAPNINKNVSRRIRDMLEAFQKYTIIVYPNDHPPAHVHFELAERIAVVELLPHVRIRENYGFSSGELQDIARVAFYFREFLLDRWDEFHPKRL